MSSHKKNTDFNDGVNQVNEPQADYEKAELDLLREGIKRSYKERFLFTTMLYKVQLTLNKAIIVHKPDNLSK